MFRIGNTPDDEQAEKQENNAGEPGNSNGSLLMPDANARNPADPPSVPRAVPDSEALAREIKEGNLSGYVGHGTSITGDIAFKGMMRVDGRVGGRLTSDGGTLIVGDGGQVDADLNIAIALIRGVVNGDITASQRVELGRTARVRGNINTASLSIDQGAVFDGSCRMSATPQVEKPAAQPTRIDRVQDYGALAASLNAAVGENHPLELGQFTVAKD